MHRFIISLATIGASVSAHCETQCSTYLGTVVAPSTFDAAISGLKPLAEKSEFETSAQFDARKRGSMAINSRILIVRKAPEDFKFFEYNADQQKLRISAYAFFNTNYDAQNALGEYGKSVNVQGNSNYQVVIEDERISGGSYAATNSYGATAEVQKMTRNIRAIFDRPFTVDISRHIYFPVQFMGEGNDQIIDEIAMTPDVARLLKPKLQIAIVVNPKEPYLVKSSHRVGRATVDRPVEITENDTIMIADIQCGLLMDGAGKVIGAYPTN